MSNILKIAGAGVSAAAEETDEYFNQTVLLLHGDGTDGTRNNTFLDSTGTHTVVRNPTDGPNAPTQGTFSPFSAPDGRWSNYFGGTSDYLETPSSSAFQFGTGAFTIECWFYVNRLPVSPAIFQILNFTDDKENISLTSAGLMSYWNGSTGYNSTATYSVGTWHHVALVRESTSSNATKVYLDGVLIITATSSTNHSSNRTFVIGARAAATKGDNCLDGYLSNVRVAKSAIYTGAFTPSTEPLTTTSQSATNVVLLTCQSNRFVDNSASPLSLTIAGNTKVTPFSPFAPTAAYSASVNGGSGYFDGTGDYLTIPDSTDFDFGAGAFCIECWVYQTAASAAELFGSWHTTSGASREYFFAIDGSQQLWFAFYNTSNSAVTLFQTGTILINQWNHLVVCRNGSNNWAAFINGARVGTSSSTDTIRALSNSYYVGIFLNGVLPLTGYMSDLRVVKGDSVYDPTSTTLTIPTAPLTAISNTSLLLNFTNAGIFDNTGKNNLETVGNAQIDTTTKKYGTGSMEFDGTGDYLIVPNSVDNQLGTGQFTIEAWIYPNSTTSKGIVAKGTGGAGGSGWLLWINASDQLAVVYDATSTFSSSGTISTGVWTHVALVREGTGTNETKLYINGVNDGTGTISSDFNQTVVLQIGTDRNNNASAQWNGFIDDLRITKGVARYTTTFTPPTKAFPDL